MTAGRGAGRLLAACLLALAVAAALALWLPARQAGAHAILVRSDPPVNAQLRDAPSTVSAFFSESLDTRLSSLRVLDAGSGQRVDAGETAFGPEDARMSSGIPEPLQPGLYVVQWETLSSVDGHLLKGSFPFTVLNPDGSLPPNPSLILVSAVTGYSGAGPTWERVAAKWLGLAAAALVAGSLAWAVWVVRPASAGLAEQWKQRVRRAARERLAWVGWPGLGLLALAGGAEIVLQARQLGGLGSLDDALDTAWGERWLQRQLVLAAMAVAFFLSARLWRAGRGGLSEAALWVALAGGLAYLLLVALVSHGGAVPGSFWAVSADFLHLAAVSVWTGMLAQLVLFLLWARRAVPDDARPALSAAHLQRFSAIAATSVVVLLATGAVNGLTQIPVPEAMLNTAYGRSLTVKLSLMAVLLAVAAVNTLVLRPRLVAGDGGGGRTASRLLALTRVELALAGCVLAATAVLVQYPTARQDRAAEANLGASAQAVVGYDEVQQAGDITANVSISPNAVGTNSYRVFLFPAGGGDLSEVQRVRLRFRPPDPQTGPSEIVAEPAGQNAWKAIGPFFTQPGAWEVQVDVRRRELEDVTAVFRVDVAGGEAESGGRFALPLVAGSWGAVGAVGVLLAALLMAVWAAQWPGLPDRLPPLLRTGSAAITVIGVAFLAFSLWPGGESASGNPIDPSGDSIAIGRSLYTQNCAQCHGAGGRGDGPQAASLDVRPADFRAHIPYHSDKFFFQIIGNGLGRLMPPFGDQLTPDQRWHLINFLKSEFGPDAQGTGP